MSVEEINIDKALAFIRNNAGPLSKAKAERIYLEQYRKSLKAILIQECEDGTIQTKESYAYSHPDYLELLQGLKAAVEEEEKIRWLMIAAQAKIEVYRTQQANNRFIDKAHT